MTLRRDALTILLTNMILSGRSGTEIVVRNLARAFLDMGHRPIVYSPMPGAFADEVRALSVPVVSDIRTIQQPIDVIHGHHLPATVAAVARYPDTPAIFVCHDFVAWHDSPPHLPSICRYVAVDDTVAERLLADGVDAAKLRTLLNRVDIDRFLPGAALPDRPRRALAFAKNHGHIEAVQAACLARGILLDVVGPNVGRPVIEPQQLMNDYDLVFASAMTAMEAMACGRGVVVCDGRGLAGWVTPERYEEWRPRNFGIRVLRGRLTPGDVGHEIDRFSAADAAHAMQRIRAEGGVRAQADAFVDLYREVIAEWALTPRAPEAFHAALAGHLQEWYPNANGGTPWMREREILLAEHEALIAGGERCAMGVTYRFADRSTEAAMQTLRGWSIREDWGLWTDGPNALLSLRAPGAEALEIHLRVTPFLTSAHTVQRVRVDVNGLPVANWSFSYADEQPVYELCLAVPADRISDDGRLWLQFTLLDAMSPASVTDVADPRLLGIGLVDLRIVPAPDPAAA